MQTIQDPVAQASKHARLQVRVNPVFLGDYVWLKVQAS